MVTIKDVAREAGVSVGTASQALRDSPAVRDATRRRVQVVAKRLRYQPSALARGLVTRRTHTVGLLISDIANPFFIRAVRAIEDVAQENGYNVILCNTDEDPAKETQYLRVLMEKRVDGIILATTAGSRQMVRDVRWRRIPLVLFDRELPRRGHRSRQGGRGDRRTPGHRAPPPPRPPPDRHHPWPGGAVHRRGASPGVPGCAAGRRAATRPGPDPGRQLQAGQSGRELARQLLEPHAAAHGAVLHQQPDDGRGVADPGRAGGPDAGGPVPDRL